MPRICIDARKLDDFGIGSYVRNLVSALARMASKDEFWLLVPNGAEAFTSRLPGNFHPVVETSVGYSLREQLAVSRRLAEIGPDLYHATHYILPGRLPCPAVVTIHDLIHLLYPQFLPHRFAYYYARFMIRRALGRARSIITVSKTSSNDLRRLFPASTTRVDVVHNGVDAVFSKEIGEDEIAERLRRLEVRPPYFLFVGNPKPHKNLDLLLRAFAAVAGVAVAGADSVPERLVVVGDRGDASPTQRLSDELGIGERVDLLGYVEASSLPAVYRGATALVHPSHYEGFGLPVVEAMASGTPVIASDIPALREIASGAAEWIDPGDETTLSEALLKLSTDPARRQELAHRGLEQARRFSWDECAEKTSEIYRQAIAKE